MRHRTYDESGEALRYLTKRQLLAFARAIVRDERVPYDALMEALDTAEQAPRSA